MRWDCREGRRPYARFYVRDANGEVIPFTLRGDTETGLVERYVVVEGRFQLDEAKRPKTVVERHPAPLVIVPVEESHV